MVHNIFFFVSDEFSDICERPRNRRRRGHGGADEVGAAAAALAAFEIAVGGGGAALAGFELVGVHPEAHGTAGFAPIETCLDEDIGDTFLFGLLFDEAGAGDDHGLDNIIGDFFAFGDFCDFAEVFDAGVGAGADEDFIQRDIGHFCAGLQAHIIQHAFDRFLFMRVVEIGGGGDGAFDGDHVFGGCAPCDGRRDVGGVERDGFIVGRVFVGFQGFPVFYGAVEFCALRRHRAVFDIVECGLVGGDEACAGAGFDRHVADGHAAFHGEVFDGFARIFKDIAIAARRADFSDDGQNHVFRAHAGCECSVDFDAHGFGGFLDEGLGGQNMFDFGCADAEGERAECAVGGGVAVAADDGHAGQGEALFGADDVDDALAFVEEVEELYAEFFAIVAQFFDLYAAVFFLDPLAAVGGGDVVIHDREGVFGFADGAAGHAQAFEGLRACDFMHEVTVDIDEACAVIALMHNVVLPDFFEKGLRCHVFF